ncbi:tyrosine-protein kinase receptor Tie-1-like, partial [Haliotis cracherodii]|uniref:tyrosine-protein kinase receptor Tie-1-like n=1 Tax=Haliotis cracherodii TaxID=6455 RepID=UPI0039E745DC
MAGVGVLGVVVIVGWIQLTLGTEINVARNKPAWMSRAFWSSPPASAAVDGVTLAHEFKYSVVTNTNETSAWWKVDLQTQVQSARVTLYFSTYYKKKRNGVQLYTSTTNSIDPKEGNLCHNVTGRADGTDIPDVLNDTCPGTWRYLTVYTETDNDGYGALLEFVEVQVWACSSGYYGSNCDQSCAARHCKSDSSCDNIRGLCVGGCAAGYQETDCTQVCDPGRYGEGCSKYCRNRRCKTQSDTCDHMTGMCPDGCASGFIGTDCFDMLTNCPPGRYGPGCTQFCNSRNCETPS